MELSHAPEYQAFRATLRAFLEASGTRVPVAATRRYLPGNSC